MKKIDDDRLQFKPEMKYSTLYKPMRIKFTRKNFHWKNFQLRERKISHFHEALVTELKIVHDITGWTEANR